MCRWYQQLHMHLPAGVSVMQFVQSVYWLLFSFIVALTSIFACHRYTGSNCQYRINECDSHPCLNGATCHDQIKYYTCHCPYGYTGKRCDSYVDWCSTEPCMNQATCKQTDNTYTCVCGPGWTGKVCDVEMVSCSDAAIRKGWCLFV
jgi:hypothetical protein